MSEMTDEMLALIEVEIRHLSLDSIQRTLYRALKAERSRVAELEASALGGYEDGWHALRLERDELTATLRDTLTEIAEAACIPFPDLATKDEIIASVTGRLAVLERVRGLQQREVIYDDFGHYYVVMSSGMRLGYVVYADELQAELDKAK